MQTEFLIDSYGKFRYDALMLVADGFTNNNFTGTWTSYKSNLSRKCNWGDYRIPESRLLDIGAGQFSVDQKYRKNGWENFSVAWNSNSETPDVKKARDKELLAWWK